MKKENTNNEMKRLVRFGVISAIIPIAALLIFIVSRSYILIDYIHVLSAAMWLGSFVFMGIIFRDVINSLPKDAKINAIRRLLPVTMFFIPSISLVTGISGYVLAVKSGLLEQFTSLFIIVIIVTVALIASVYLITFINSVKIFRRLKSHRGKDEILLYSKRNFVAALFQTIGLLAIVGLMAYIGVVLH
ncbi:MAG: conserved hypothetical membrane spanning protein [Candidatus Parvarchaeum acidophilus ARMAN-5]|jgi:putative copper export protein|uniref:Conserved hypothetical membrane spanning protein n=1 Tax=Candidatus Parvarchaeum acidophilus ARMAN-5 TaxID=662762 RepID=D6GUX0_PARA5|nr:MAG: conserved hypothetical membrane spanning protein [Candidatus Parvarchaeum acidophilus ARMAN-5]